MENTPIKPRQSHLLIYYGVLLFLLGLIVGLFIPFMANPRMGLSSHIQGTFNGLFLIVLGLIWNRVDLSARWLKITFWLSIYGTFANWLAMLIAAVFNAGKTLTVAAEGQQGPPEVEIIVMALLVSLALATLIVCVALLVGLRRHWQGKNEK